MRTKSIDLMNDIIECINQIFNESGRAPTHKEIANNFNVTEACIGKYIKEMEVKGMIEKQVGSRGVVTNAIRKKIDTVHLPIVGSVSCGSPMFAEENIQGYLSVSNEFLGAGKFYVLKANGDSMIKAGISDGDYVIIRLQETAEEGQIVVALIDDEATLKRYYLDKKKKKIRLHPENDDFEDMFFNSIKIQGVAVKIIRDLY